MNVYIDCTFCEDKTETKQAEEIYFKRGPNAIMVRCSNCGNLQMWSTKWL